MSMEGDIAQIRASLNRIHLFSHLILGETFEPDTIADMKNKAKDICDDIKSKADDIKHEIGNWG